MRLTGSLLCSYTCALLFALGFAEAVFADSRATELASVPAAEAPLLESTRYGYLLFSIANDNPNAWLRFTRLKWRDDTYPGKDEAQRTVGKAFSLPLVSNGGDLQALKLKAGWYQILEMNVPYFNLPYRLDLEDRPAWRFQVKAGAINYFGHFAIARDRGQDYVDVDLKFRPATDYDNLQSTLAHLLVSMPLVHGGGQRDDFLDTYQAP